MSLNSAMNSAFYLFTAVLHLSNGIQVHVALNVINTTYDQRFLGVFYFSAAETWSGNEITIQIKSHAVK